VIERARQEKWKRLALLSPQNPWPKRDLTNRGWAEESVVWDFGGQEIMHATHQFFLTKRSVYVLVLDARQGEIEGNIHYWLQTIQSFGGDSPVLVVTNKCDVQPLSLNENGLRRQYAPMEIGFHSVSCTTLQGVAALRDALTATIQGLAHVEDERPRTSRT